MRFQRFLVAAGFISLLFTAPLQGQWERDHESEKYWDEGKLTWDDFQEKRYSAEASKLMYFFGYYPEKERTRDSVIFHLKTYAYINKKLSWINPEYKSPLLLRYNQVIFDFVELYRRKLQSRLYEPLTPTEVNYIFQSLNYELQEFLDRFKEDTWGGRNEGAVNSWEQYIRNELSKYPENPVPHIRFSKMGWGMHVGMGIQILGSPLMQYIHHPRGLTFGMEGLYKRYALFLHSMIGGGSVKDSYFLPEGSPEKLYPAYYLLHISAGYTVFKGKKWRIIPFAGYQFSEIEIKNEENSGSYSYPGGYFLAGFNADYIIRRYYDFRPDFLRFNSEADLFLRFQLFVTEGNYTPELHGYIVHFSINIGERGHLMRPKRF